MAPTILYSPRTRRPGLSLCAAVALSLASATCLATEINAATEAELDSIRGFGPPTTARILQERTKAPFANWADLMHRIKGIQDARARKLSKEGLTVNGEAYPAP
jgi:competence protein ComEA